MQRTEVPADLLKSVKNYLNITWSDPATDDNVRGMIASASVYLDGKGGGTLDYEEDGIPRTLLMEYVRYMRDSALDVFESNYTALILGMQNERLIQNVESTDTPEG